VTSDPKNDVLAMAVRELSATSSIRSRYIYVEQDVETLHTIEVEDASGERHILLLKDPLRLTSP
jgi:Family of unknown function (DUF5335)